MRSSQTPEFGGGGFCRTLRREGVAYTSCVYLSCPIGQIRKIQYLGAPMRKIFVGIIAAAFVGLSFNVFAADPDCKKLNDKKDHKWTDAEKKFCKKS